MPLRGLRLSIKLSEVNCFHICRILPKNMNQIQSLGLLDIYFILEEISGLGLSVYLLRISGVSNQIGVQGYRKK